MSKILDLLLRPETPDVQKNLRTKEYELPRLSEIYGEPFVVQLKGVPYGRALELREMKDYEVQTVRAGDGIGVWKDETLLESKGAATPAAAEYSASELIAAARSAFGVSPDIMAAALKTAGVPAAYLNRSLTPEQSRTVYRNLLAGRYKILYVAPERLDFEGFSAIVRQLCISFVAVDEAHCISQWGQDFRPSYLRIVHFLESLEKRPVVGAYTATATAQVRRDVERILNLHNPVRRVTGFDRPNLYFQVLHPQSKDEELKRLIAPRNGKSGIVYCATRRKVEYVCRMLQDLGYPATQYHAGLPEEERRNNQEDFLHDRKTIMVATNAFGMGIDKSNVRYVIHYNMPKSLEAYYQEAGRAGRDGTDGACILLYSGADVHMAQYLINNGSENEELDEAQRQRVRHQDLQRLESMIGYCTTSGCLRGYILEYFGQKHLQLCGNCGNCGC